MYLGIFSWVICIRSHLVSGAFRLVYTIRTEMKNRHIHKTLRTLLTSNSQQMLIIVPAFKLETHPAMEAVD